MPHIFRKEGRKYNSDENNQNSLAKTRFVVWGSGSIFCFKDSIGIIERPFSTMNNRSNGGTEWMSDDIVVYIHVDILYAIDKYRTE